MRRWWRARTFDGKRSSSPSPCAAPSRSADAPCRRFESLASARSGASTRRQDGFPTLEVPSPFRAKRGEKRPGLTGLYSGPFLTKRSFLIWPSFETGLFNPGGSGHNPGRSGPNERGLK